MEDKFGINMKQYCRGYEKAVREALAEGKAGPDMLDAHREKIRILQHERRIIKAEARGRGYSCEFTRDREGS